jgi:hypothetical protein
MIGLALMLGLVAMVSGPAGAVSPLPITCTAAGTVTATDLGETDSWSIPHIMGSCQGDLGGTYFVTAMGFGTSNGLGLCDGSLVVRNLDITVFGTLTSFATGVISPFAQSWTAPITTYPLGTPFLVGDSGGGIGAGSIFNHIFLNCSGSPVAQFTWSWLT